MFNKAIIKASPPRSCAFELKIVKGKSMPFNKVALHQVHNLKLAQKALVYKIADVGLAPKPFDCFYLKEALAYVVIWFYKPRQPKECILIEVNTFERESLLSKRRSLTEARAKELGIIMKFG